MHKKFLALFFGIIALFPPQKAFGLAGFSETSSEFYYSENILIEFNTPSDTCPKKERESQTCITLRGTNNNSELFTFSNLPLLTEINIPVNTQQKFIFGKSYEDEQWLIYNIFNDHIFIKNSDYALVLLEWKRMGNDAPVLVNTKNFPEYFYEETEESQKNKKEQEEFASLLLLTGLCIIGIPFLIGSVILGIVYFSFRKARKNRIRKLS